MGVSEGLSRKTEGVIYASRCIACPCLCVCLCVCLSESVSGGGPRRPRRRLPCPMRVGKVWEHDDNGAVKVRSVTSTAALAGPACLRWADRHSYRRTVSRERVIPAASTRQTPRGTPPCTTVLQCREHCAAECCMLQRRPGDSNNKRAGTLPTLYTHSNSHHHRHHHRPQPRPRPTSTRYPRRPPPAAPSTVSSIRLRPLRPSASMPLLPVSAGSGSGSGAYAYGEVPLARRGLPVLLRRLTKFKSMVRLLSCGVQRSELRERRSRQEHTPRPTRCRLQWGAGCGGPLGRRLGWGTALAIRTARRERGRRRRLEEPRSEDCSGRTRDGPRIRSPADGGRGSVSWSGPRPSRRLALRLLAARSRSRGAREPSPPTLALVLTLTLTLTHRTLSSRSSS